MTMKTPRYSLWEAINAALAVGTKALEEVRTLARVPGPAGKDGLGFEHMEFVQTSERNFVLRFTRGQELKEFPFRFNVPLYRGVWREGHIFESADRVTWGGSEWHCNEPTSDKPGEGSKAWTLCTKRGRDGKDKS